MHDNTDTDERTRPATKHDVEAAAKDVESVVLAATALPTAALAGITPGPPGTVLTTAAVFLLWISFARSHSGVANLAWNSTLGRASMFRIDETAEDIKSRGEPA